MCGLFGGSFGFVIAVTTISFVMNSRTLNKVLIYADLLPYNQTSINP